MQHLTSGDPSDWRGSDAISGNQGPADRFELRYDASDADRIREITLAHGLDHATDVLYHAVLNAARGAEAIQFIDRQIERSSAEEKAATQSNLQMAIVPGFLYREYPSSGADGRMLVEAAEKRGWAWERIPVASTGRLQDNAETIIRWLKQHGDRPTVLASISKGSSDVAAALRHPDAADAFANVVGWVNVCGIIHGSPVVDAILKKRLATLGFRTLFLLRRWCFRSVTDLGYHGGPLRNGFALPKGMKAVHAIGFPMEADMVHSRLRKFRQLVGGQGPNDGAILLMDTIHAPGVVYPVRGADHYMRPRHKVQPILDGLLEYLISDVGREVSHV